MTRSRKSAKAAGARFERLESPEEWRPIPGWEGMYEASSHGRIRSIDREVPDSCWGTRKVRGKILKLRRSPQNRPLVNLCRNSVCKNVTVHSLVMAAFVGPRPEGQVIRHLNDDPWDNRLENLAYGTQRDNAHDLIRNGRHFDTNKTHCPRGHDLVAPNLVACTARKGYRDCLACSRARAYRQKRGGDLQLISDSYFEKIMGAA